MSEYRISVIMPSLNEEKNLEQAVQNVIGALDRCGVRGEIIVVNDGSTDETGRIAEDLGEQHRFLSVLHHEKPQGIGASFWDGVQSAKAEIVTMMPGDGENDAAETLRYLPLLDHVDIVVPFVCNKEVRSGRRRALSAVYRWIINLSFGLSLNYTNGTVMYRKCVLDGMTLRSRGFFYQTELLIKSIRKGYLYAEVPYALGGRATGDSKATTLASLLRVMRNYFAMMLDVYMKSDGGEGVSPDSVTALRWKRIQEDAADAAESFHE
jgi:glycosyltransferase involved in cell wall biosynthesis